MPAYYREYAHMSLRHVIRYADAHTPREIAKAARDEGYHVDIPDSPQGTPFERQRQIIEQKRDLLFKIERQRRLEAMKATPPQKPGPHLVKPPKR